MATTITGTQAARELAAMRRPKTKVCAFGGCEEIFTTVGRGLYHSDRCKQRAKYLKRKEGRNGGNSDSDQAEADAE